MNVLAFASRKGGAGKSTLAAHLAVHAQMTTRACLLVDDDPQGSLTLWNELRAEYALPLKTVKRGIAPIVKKAERRGVKWIFVDTPPNASMSVIEAMEAATLVVIPCRPGLFDIDAVQETIAFARHVGTPYVVVLNAAPPKRQDIELPAVASARSYLAHLEVPVWGGQITHRASFSLAVGEAEGAWDACAAAEIAGLWSAIEKSVKVIHGARDKTAMHRVAA